MTTQQYLEQLVNYGGTWVTRAEVYADFKKLGYDERAASMWLAGYDYAARRTPRS